MRAALGAVFVVLAVVRWYQLVAGTGIRTDAWLQWAAAISCTFLAVLFSLGAYRWYGEQRKPHDRADAAE